MQSFRWKKNVCRINQTNNAIAARCHFLREYVRFLRDTDTEVFYFDWTSFSSQNFQAKSWSESGMKSIVTDSYPYAKLHLLALLGPDRLVALQYVAGTLNSPVVFDFLFQVLCKVTRKAHQIGKAVVIVLDNSPLNHSKALKNLARYLRLSFLFTAANSSFLNPIEMLFAKFKAGFKTKNSASK